VASFTDAVPEASHPIRRRLQRLPSLSRRRRLVAHCLAIVVSLALSGAALTAMGFAPIDIGWNAILATIGTDYGLAQTAILAAPLVLTGLAVAIAMKIGVWNVGAEGQLYMGAWAAAGIGLFVKGSAWLLFPTMFVAAGLAGALWILIPAVGRVWLGISEIITTLLLNFVAMLWVYYMAIGPWRDPKAATLSATARIPYELPALDNGIHIGVLIALLLVALLAIALRYSRWGYEVLMIGANARAADYAGMAVARRMVGVMLLSGALAGVAGMIELTGVVHRLQGGISNQYGALGIPIAALAAGSPVGVLVGACLIAILLNAGISLQTQGLSVNAVLALTGLILFMAATAESVARYSFRSANPGAGGE
jgi:ABC-type uncharacterized transport system permease subunit